jgi:DNA/RNA endonuclease YhcR with UshA esterase domain
MIRVKGHSNLYKTSQGAIVNTDYDAFVRAKKRKSEKDKINMIEQRLDNLESLLTRLLEHVNPS